MNNSTESVIPPWLHDLFLGYGDPLKTQYKHLMATKSINPTTGEVTVNESVLPEVDFRDTFLDQEHLISSFPDAKVNI